MSKTRSSRTSPLALALRKLFVSVFFVFAFVAYVVHDRLVNADLTSSDYAPSSGGAQTQSTNASQQILPIMQRIVPTSQYLAPTLEKLSASTQQIAPTAQPVMPTNTPFVPTETPIPPTATEKPQGQYQDGVYTGPTINAFYGLVQVQATVQKGRLTDVQFLQYPNDRRTSQRINSIAMPYLTQEAIQAQSAHINIISGATLTSLAFAQSLYSVLNQVANQS